MSDDFKPLPNPPPGTLPPITGTGPVKPLAPPSLPPVAESGVIILDARSLPSSPLPCGLKDPDAGDRIIELPVEHDPSLDDSIVIDSAGDGTRQTKFADVLDMLVDAVEAATRPAYCGKSPKEVLSAEEVVSDLTFAMVSPRAFAVSFPEVTGHEYAYFCLPADYQVLDFNLVGGAGWCLARGPEFPETDKALWWATRVIGGQEFRLYRSCFAFHGALTASCTSLFNLKAALHQAGSIVVAKLKAPAFQLT